MVPGKAPQKRHSMGNEDIDVSPSQLTRQQIAARRRGTFAQNKAASALFTLKKRFGDQATAGPETPGLSSDEDESLEETTERLDKDLQNSGKGSPTKKAKASPRKEVSLRDSLGLT